MSQDECASQALGSAILTHERGFHARPSIMLTQLAKRFSAKVWIGLSDCGPWTDAKSIARVMALKAPQHTTVFFAAEGSDAAEAVGALVKLIDSDFSSSIES